MSRQAVLASYRNLLRAREKAFKGDKRMLNFSFVEIKKQYQQNKHLRDADQISLKLLEAKEASYFIGNGIAQGVQKDGGHEYDVRIDNEQITPNLDSNITLKMINEDTLKREERKASRKKQ